MITAYFLKEKVDSSPWFDKQALAFLFAQLIHGAALAPIITLEVSRQVVALCLHISHRMQRDALAHLPHTRTSNRLGTRCRGRMKLDLRFPGARSTPRAYGVARYEAGGCTALRASPHLRLPQITVGFG